MQFTQLAVLLATAGAVMATPVQPATDVAARDLPAGVTFIASDAISASDSTKTKRGYVSDACIGTCWSGYSSGMVSFVSARGEFATRTNSVSAIQCFWNCWDGQKCGYSVGTCQDKRWNE